jgi:SHS2 domain-containing protein
MLDHTADVGFALEAESLPDLFDAARQGLLEVMFERPPEGGAEEREVQLSGPDLETLLVRWINELTYLIQTAEFVPAAAGIGFSEDRRSLRARFLGTALAPEEQGFLGEVKSATFHGLSVERVNGLWRAQVILDV